MAHCSDADAALLEVSVTLTEELEDCLYSVTNCADKGVQRSGLGQMMRGLGNGIAPTGNGNGNGLACSELASLANLCSLSSLSL